MRRAQSRLQNSDYSGIEYLLSAYGGMGSFNDLILGQTTSNGRFLACKPGYQQLNKELDQLRHKIWEIAQWIKCHHERSGS